MWKITLILYRITCNTMRKLKWILKKNHNDFYFYENSWWIERKEAYDEGFCKWYKSCYEAVKYEGTTPHSDWISRTLYEEVQKDFNLYKWKFRIYVVFSWTVWFLLWTLLVFVL